MAVNLNGIDLTGGAPSGSAHRTSSTQVTTAESKDNAAQPSEVNITGTASLLAAVEKSLSALPAVNQNRVAEISKAITAGTYQVSPDKIAAGLIQVERDLATLPAEL